MDFEIMEIDIGKWVKQARESADLSQEQLALDLGYKGKGTVSAWEKNTNAIPFDKILEISQRTGAVLPYANQSDSRPVVYKDPNDGPIKLKLYDVAASCGSGRFNSNYPDLIRTVSFTEEAALELFGTTNLNHVQMIPPDGDSMEPTIPQKSMCFIKTDINEIVSSGIYLFTFQGATFFKRLHISKGNVIQVTSDNRVYEKGDFEITPSEQDELVIHGKLWRAVDLNLIQL
ncbi:helix-turn-helix domain-containing protein [Vitreoscilla massiliensis]|uniref:Helix-turn-helix domain-containing protein n=1 Tax=Vitreoscilla massiliensis TaxID=1689272 RepID=A0ABY4E2Q7_9NEIS|nr:S24 family peptidase [Vitreoscilla massiliensis]UOO89539.1 helix-turn-helix domain-containing protein [Vitreoscilla massiliensis]